MRRCGTLDAETLRLVLATGAPAVKIIQNNGAEAGQIVFHCHFHVLPKYSTSDSAANSKDMVTPAAAKAILAKMHACDAGGDTPSSTPADRNAARLVMADVGTFIAAPRPRFKEQS